MKNIYCIVGPSGCGKTTLVEALEAKYGFKAVQSYTTRPPRFEGETGHIFVTPEEFKALGEMCAYTEFDGYEYGVTSDLIEHNDLYVIDPSGVEFLREKYNGTKGIKVIGITAGTEVLIERMHQRGDSDQKIVKRLANDAKMFKNFTNIVDITLRSDANSVNELCDAVKWHIEDMEYWQKHEFSLLNDRGEEVYYGRETRFTSLDDFREKLKQNYPEGLPKGWALRDDTEVARKEFLKVIKRLKPSFKSSMIDINMERAGVPGGYFTAVSFKYMGKEYYYRAHNGDEWIAEKTSRVSVLSGSERIENDLAFLQKRLNDCEKRLRGECLTEVEFDYEAFLREKERLNTAISLLGQALEFTKKNMEAKKPALKTLIAKADDNKSDDIAENGNFERKSEISL